MSKVVSNRALPAPPVDLKRLGGKPLVVVAEDDSDFRDTIAAILREALGDVEVFGTDTYSTALGRIRSDSRRVVGVVSDVNYYEKPDSPDTDQCCGRRIAGEVREIDPKIPVIIQSSDASYAEDPAIKGRATFIEAFKINSEGVGLFRRVFGGRLRDLTG